MRIRLLAMLALLATAPAPSRDDRWRKDIAVARTEFLPKDLSFSPRTHARARARLDALERAVPRLADQQIVAELARVAALAGNAHTRAYLLRNRGWWRRYPIRLWKFSDGWRIVAARPGEERLLGARVRGIGGVPVARAEAAVRPLFAGPAPWASYMATYSLSSPDALLGTGVISGGDGATQLDLEKDGRRFRARVAAAAEPQRARPEESWWFLSPAHPATQGWRHVLAQRPLPAQLERPDAWYALRRCAGNVLYLQFNRAEDQPGRPTLAAFGARVMADLARDARSRLVVDLRFNTGGNLLKTRGLFEDIARSGVGAARGRLFVALGPATFSAGITPAAILRQGSKATLVGGEPGDRLHFWAEGGNVELPNSRITLHYADRAHLYGPGGPQVPGSLVYLRLNAASLRPDVPGAASFGDYLAGRDPVTERVVPGGLRCDPEG